MEPVRLLPLSMSKMTSLLVFKQSQPTKLYTSTLQLKNYVGNGSCYAYAHVWIIPIHHSTTSMSDHLVSSCAHRQSTLTEIFAESNTHCKQLGINYYMTVFALF